MMASATMLLPAPWAATLLTLGKYVVGSCASAPLSWCRRTSSGKASRKWDGERYVTRRALPMRIPVADWPHINRYFEEPADLAHPSAGEMWSEHELHAYGDWLSEEQVRWALSVQSYEEDEDVGPQPTIAEVKQAWIEEATRMGLVSGPQDVPGLQELKRDWSADPGDEAAVVDQKLICRVIADMTRIPVTEVEEEETDKLLRT